MLISIADFQGEFPARTPRILPPNAAQIAQNTRLDDGTLTPFAGSTFTTDLVTPKKTVYLNGSTWLAWDTEVDAVPGPTATDRLYVTGDGVPKMFHDDTWYSLALPAPADAPSTAIVVGAVDPENIEAVVYAYTFVTSLGEESAPSPLSTSLDWSEGCTVRVSGFSAAPVARAVDRIRIYRSETSESGITDLYFVSEQPVATAQYDHDVALEPIQEAITTTDHATPPDDMRGLISMPNGMMVAHTSRELLFSEPYQPHSWPVKYALKVDYDIVGLAAFGSQLAVMTAGTPYRGQGTHPDTFALEKIEENLPCLAKRGIVDLGYAAAYPSTEGLVLVTGSTARVITRRLFPRHEWADLSPATFVAANHAGRYMFGFAGSFEQGSEKTGIIDLTGDTPFLIRSDVTVKCAYTDIRTGRTYVQDADEQLYVFDDTAAADWRDQVWRSKLFDMSYSPRMSVILVEGKDLTTPSGFAARIYANGALLHTIADMNTPLRLPENNAEHWEIEVSGKVEVTSISLATSMQELAGRP